MKINRALGAALLAVIIASISFFSFNTATAKNARPGDDLRSDAIDAKGTVSGARVFYQLLPEEGGVAYQFANGTFATKVPAEVTFNYFGERDEGGHLVFAVFIKRPDFLGGPFSKDKVRFSSAREPGTIDRRQPGDLVN